MVFMSLMRQLFTWSRFSSGNLSWMNRVGRHWVSGCRCESVCVKHINYRLSIRSKVSIRHRNSMEFSYFTSFRSIARVGDRTTVAAQFFFHRSHPRSAGRKKTGKFLNWHQAAQILNNEYETHFWRWSNGFVPCLMKGQDINFFMVYPYFKGNAVYPPTSCEAQASCIIKRHS